MSPDYSIRVAKPEDVNFILATMLRGLYYGDTWFSQIPKDLFMREHHRVLVNTMSRPDCSVKVACLPDDVDVILGYSVVIADKALVWTYVKSSFRKMGIAKQLVPPTITSVSYLTKSGASILKKHPGVLFNPYIS